METNTPNLSPERALGLSRFEANQGEQTIAPESKL